MMCTMVRNRTEKVGITLPLSLLKQTDTYQINRSNDNANRHGLALILLSDRDLDIDGDCVNSADDPEAVVLF
jgi:hypothetical protein